MVAIIQTGHSLKRAFYYNENKEKMGNATCLHAENYPMDAADMNEYQRINMLLKTAEKNPNVKRNSVHISLNFAPGEQLSDGTLKDIASEYMERIGFGDQPYLVYRHDDAAHPHIHLVSVNVRPDGSRIDMNNIGENESDKARKILEEKYGLVKAEDQQQQDYKLKSAYTPKAVYGKLESKNAIGNVLNDVLNTYKFASLPELNAVLKLYNVMADRGAESSRVNIHKGLLYRILDEQGKPVGVPIKASLFYNKPTLANLEKRFLKNDVERQKRKAATRNTIDSVLRKHSGTNLKQLMEQLGKRGVDVVLRQNNDDLIYGVTYVDHTTACVFNGSALGKEYSAKGLLERCGIKNGTGHAAPPIGMRQAMDQRQKQPLISNTNDADQQDTTANINTGTTPLEVLTRAEETYSYVPYDLRKKKKKKRKGQSK